MEYEENRIFNLLKTVRLTGGFTPVFKGGIFDKET